MLSEPGRSLGAGAARRRRDPSVDRTTRRIGVPEHGAGAILRPRLLALMDEGVAGGTTLLSAPAGTGKSLLVSTWASTEPTFPVVWLTLTRSGGAELMWHSLPHALRRCGVPVPQLGRPVDGPSPTNDWTSRLGAAIAAGDTPLVLVLDEADTRTDPAFHRSLATLVDRAGPALRLVLLVRSDPVLPLNRYRMAHQLTEIRAADLSFDEHEAGLLFERSGLALTPAQTTALVRRTSGWALGLAMAARGVHRRADVAEAIADFSGSETNVSTYLATEVLESQPPGLAEALLRTSVVDALAPGLFEALTGLENGQNVMGFMARGNSFIEPVPEFPGWYRYQSLFREFLRARLEREQPELVRELHRAAADWFARNGFLTMAVQHACTDGDWGAGARFLVDDLSIGALLVEVWSSGRSSAFAEMPESQTGTAAAVVRAALALGAADPSRCARELTRARSLLAADASSTAAEAFSIALLETLLAVSTGDTGNGLEAARSAEQQLRSSWPDSGRTRPELALLLGLARARLDLWSGDLDGAADALSGLCVAEPDPRCGRLGLVALSLVALVDAVRGRLQDAAGASDAAEQVARAAGLDRQDWPWELSVARAWVLVEQLDLEAADEQLYVAETAVAGHDPVRDGLVALLSARLLRARGRAGEAKDVLDAAGACPGQATSPWILDAHAAARADLMLAAGRAHDARESLPGSLGPASALALRRAMVALGETGATSPHVLVDTQYADQRLELRVVSRLVEAAEQAASDTAGAQAAVDEALELAAPARLRRPFTELVPEVGDLWRGSGRRAHAAAWLQTGAEHGGLAAASTVRPGAGRSEPAGCLQPVDQLTSKEQEVLGHLADLLSTTEIAEAMFISTNTVRTHVRNILRKLSVGRRNDAIRRAWELGLLVPPWGDG